MPLRLALTVQLVLYAVAIVAAAVATVRAVRLQRRAAGQAAGRAWWETAEARTAIGHAVRPLWWTAAALIIGAFAPRLLGALHG